MSGIAESLLGVVQQITIESKYLPPIVLQDPFAPGKRPSPLLSALQPKITIQIAGTDPIVIAPYGEPGPTRWPVIQGALIALAVVVVALLLRMVLRPARRR